LLLHGIDATRRGFDRNSDSLALFPDPAFRRSVMDWYRDALLARLMLEEYDANFGAIIESQRVEEHRRDQRALLGMLSDLDRRGKKLLESMAVFFAPGGYLLKASDVPPDDP